MKRLAMLVLVVLVGCGGSEFAGTEISMVPDAALDGFSEVDSGQPITEWDARADMVSSGDAPGTFEGSAPDGSDGGTLDGSTPDGAEDGSSVPTCGADEVYPQASPTCEKWIKTTPWPGQRGCCRRDVLTCGVIVTFSPFCVEAH